MDSSRYTQFKLTSGEEIIAEIVDEPEGDDSNIVIRNAMEIYSVTQGSTQGYRYYGFKPWMTFQMKSDYLQLLNFHHIVGEAKPDITLFSEYQKALDNELLSEEEQQNRVDEYYEALKKRLSEMVETELDSDGGDDDNNVVSLFKDKSKLH